MAMMISGKNIMVLLKPKINVYLSSMGEVVEMATDLIQKKNADGSVNNMNNQQIAVKKCIFC